MAAIRSGPLETALEAVKALGALVHDSGAQAELSAPGTVRAVLQLYTSDIVRRKDVDAFEEALEEIVLECPDATAQLIAAYADPDPCVAFAAICFSQSLLAFHPAAERMLEAGTAKALVAALSHASQYCRGAAAALSVTLPHLMANALREAGLVPALVAALLGSPLEPSPLPASSPPCLCRVAHMYTPSGDRVAVPFNDPTLMGYVTLTRLAGCYKWAAEEMCQTDAGQAIMRGLREGSREVTAASAGLLYTVLQRLDAGPHMRAFGQDLVEKGLLALIARLIRPGQPQTAAHVMRALPLVLPCVDRSVGVPFGSALLVRAALEKFLDSKYLGAESEFTTAVQCLFAITAGYQQGGLRSGLSCRPLSAKVITKLCRMLVTEDWEAVFALELVMDALQEDKSGATLDTAVSAGFVPGVVRMLKGLTRSTFPVAPLPVYFYKNYATPAPAPGQPNPPTWVGVRNEFLDNTMRSLRRGLLEVVLTMRLEYILQAVRCGLLTELRGLLSCGTEQAHIVVCRVSIAMLLSPEGVAMLRKEGLMPSIFLELADSPHSEVALELGQNVQNVENVENVENGVIEDRRHARDVVGELRAAGVTEKLSRRFPILRGGVPPSALGDRGQP